ncbi:hypothetical protein EYC84_003708 [Monilinia fructicola]|uniref:Uncharacterized protein n=1 Tax=Monilinia fructicola TaxID=38448 RepID=A0A5M9K2S4_MONFR|nr:hypothetical protein EYC84_003708 [Monilinia fructicola]
MVVDLVFSLEGSTSDSLAEHGRARQSTAEQSKQASKQARKQANRQSTNVPKIDMPVNPWNRQRQSHHPSTHAPIQPRTQPKVKSKRKQQIGHQMTSHTL